LGAISLSQSKLGAIFARIFWEVAQISTDFHQIKTFGGSQPPTPLAVVTSFASKIVLLFKHWPLQPRKSILAV